jgi:hypothetical protein
MEANSEPTAAEKNAFRRAFLDAMKSMATVVAYVFAADYVKNQPHASALGAIASATASMILIVIATIGAIFTVDLLMVAIHQRFPHIRNRKILLFITAAAAGMVGSLPMYVRGFH